MEPASTNLQPAKAECDVRSMLASRSSIWVRWLCSAWAPKLHAPDQNGSSCRQQDFKSRTSKRRSLTTTTAQPIVIEEQDSCHLACITVTVQQQRLIVGGWQQGMAPGTQSTLQCPLLLDAFGGGSLSMPVCFIWLSNDAAVAGNSLDRNGLAGCQHWQCYSSSTSTFMLLA